MLEALLINMVGILEAIPKRIDEVDEMPIEDLGEL